MSPVKYILILVMFLLTEDFVDNGSAGSYGCKDCDDKYYKVIIVTCTDHIEEQVHTAPVQTGQPVKHDDLRVRLQK